MSKANEQAQAFLAAAQKHGFRVSCTRSVVSISREFTPGDHNAFNECDMFAGSVLAEAPLKGGSVWGTDGGSIGGHVAIQSGFFNMKKSGTGVRFTTALAKLVG